MDIHDSASKADPKAMPFSTKRAAEAKPPLSSIDRYDPVEIACHWATAVLVITLSSLRLGRSSIVVRQLGWRCSQSTSRSGYVLREYWRSASFGVWAGKALAHRRFRVRAAKTCPPARMTMIVATR